MKRLLWVVIFAIIFMIGLSNFFLNEYRLLNNFNEIRERLMLIASNAALSIDTDKLLSVPLVQRGEGTPEYQEISRKLEKIKITNPLVKYAYIMTVTDQPGILQYVVDADPVPPIITAHCPTSLPGDKYDARNLPEMMGAYYGPTADKKITSDVWGVFISGYAPIRDVTGKSIAILGIDTDATLIQVIQKNAKAAGFIALFTLFLFILSLVTLTVNFKTKKDDFNTSKN